MRLVDLPTWDGRDTLRVVVESPRGSTAKLKYDPDLDAFVFQRSLAHGIAYPYDWGFFPRTLAADGDPVDVMIVHDAATYPGVVIRCKALAVLKVTQKAKSGRGRERNDRVVAVPVGESSSHARELGPRMRRELENFFMSAVLLQGKDLRFAGWGRAWEARKIVRSGQRVFAEKQGSA
jgi:inorganic pyrophosphatase